MARAKWEAYATPFDGEPITYGPEWIYAPDAVIMCPVFNGGEDVRLDQLLSPEVLAAVYDLGPDADTLTPEVRMWKKFIPDWRITTPFACNAADWGFSMRDVYSGTRSDGTVIELHEWDYVWTDENGHITRWDWFIDSGEWRPFLALIGLDPEGLTYQHYVATYLRMGASDS